ncbi:HEPN domain-containing protein [Aquimarina aquimarini]|uniref:HEPN domain-containing protein n=1 Tax=Aquimarina aquimarini TaxID=1191734 RepID=UPI000D55C553|nr:HEPN domain-containing protein [Aquimarina aquimarini]
MIVRTNAFNTLQRQVQETFDFAVVVCHSVPALKLQMNLLDKGTINQLPTPDYFTINTTTELRTQANGYKEKLATYLFLSSFSFFENYFGSVLKEVFDLNTSIPDKATLENSLNNNTDTKPKRALKGTYDKKHHQRYEKYSSELKANGYISPDELLKIVAFNNLYKTVQNLKANEIPDFLISHFKIEITDTEKAQFSTYRQLRNDIAHGDNPNLDLRKVKEANAFLRKLAAKIDAFLTEHYIKLNNYLE